MKHARKLLIYKSTQLNQIKPKPGVPSLIRSHHFLSPAILISVISFYHRFAILFAIE